MENSQSKALSKRKSEASLMPPPPPKRQKRPAQVLDDDVFSDALSYIIARDYFPGLVETEAQQEFMNAVDSKNNDWIREAARNLTHVMTPSRGEAERSSRAGRNTPRRSKTVQQTPRRDVYGTPHQTPPNDPDGHFAPDKLMQMDLNLSLDAFMAKYTSEDNESFNDILDQQNKKHAAKYSFFHAGNTIPSARQIAYRESQQNILGDDPKSTALVRSNATGQAREMVSKPRPSEDLDARPSAVDGFSNSQGARNSLMFEPEGVEDRIPAVSQELERRSNAPPKSVRYSATRFQAPSNGTHDSVPPSPSISAINAAIEGRSKPTESEPGFTGAETPRVNGYAFVDAEPTPSELGIPVTDEDADAAEREMAMQLLPKVDETGPNRFELATRSKREELHLKLVDKASAMSRKRSRIEELRDLGITPGRTPTPKFATSPSVKKGAGMTPAAKRLAETIGTPTRNRNAFDAGEKSTERSGKWTSRTRNKEAA